MGAVSEPGAIATGLTRCTHGHLIVPGGDVLTYRFMKTRLTFVAVLIIFLFVSNSSAQTRNSPRRIVFARGATVARAAGYLRGMRDEAWFVLRAKAGQLMRVEIRGRGPTRGILIWPSGKQDGGPGGVIFNGEIDEDGDYKIRVTESMMAEAWRGRFTVIVEALPRGQTSPSSLNLETYAGKYPDELFRDVPAVKTRVRQLLGANYKAFTDRMQVETPFDKDGDLLITRGCMAHSCGSEDAILAIETDDGRVYVALKVNSRISKTFPANQSLLPDALRRAMAQ